MKTIKGKWILKLLNNKDKMGNEGKSVRMTDEELEQFNQFKAEKAKQDEIKRVKIEREQYKMLVDSEIESAIPMLLTLSEDLKDTKYNVMENFRAVLDLKAKVMGLTRDDQRSHTFTNSRGDMRITIGFYVTDGYRDTCEDGIQIVKEYLESLAVNKDSQTLVKGILSLLSRDQKGTLKASRILSLRKMAEESGNDRFIEGVKIIEESYQSVISKQYIRAEKKNDTGAWINIPLGMTES